MVEEQPLFFEDVYDAFRHITRVIGPKTAGSALFPHKENPETAARYLADNLNPNRGEKLDMEQIIQLLKLGKEAGCHTAINYLCGAAGYSNPTPISPDDERSDLQRKFIQSVQELSILSNRIKATNGGGL